jgi:hypothetical protein
VEIPPNLNIIKAGEYQPNANEEVGPFEGFETISDVRPMKPARGHINIFIRLPTSK